MSQMLRKSSRSRSCIRYEKAFKPEEMERVKLSQHYTDGSTVTRKATIFTGEEGIEGLLFSYNRFRRVAAALEYTEGTELFDNWDTCLASTAEDQWDTLTAGIAEAERDVARFDAEIENYKLQYCDRNARDVMTNYLRSDECKKKYNADVRVHGERIRTMCKACNELPGNVPELNEAARKEILYQSYPEEWRLNYESSGHDYANATEQDIMAAMAIEKVKADKREDHSKRSGRGGRGRDGPHKRGRGNYGSYQTHSSEPSNRSYYRGGGYQNNGRFGSRGYSGGRGFGGGRGNGGRGFSRGYGGRSLGSSYGGGRGRGYYGNYGGGRNGSGRFGRGNYGRGDRTHGNNGGGRETGQNYHYDNSGRRPSHNNHGGLGWAAEAHHYDNVGPSSCDTQDWDGDYAYNGNEYEHYHYEESNYDYYENEQYDETEYHW